MDINYNQMGINVANTIISHFGNFQAFTQPLSSGLGINSASHNVARRAIRGLMYAHIWEWGHGNDEFRPHPEPHPVRRGHANSMPQMAMQLIG